MRDELTNRAIKLWWKLVVDGVRSKSGATLLVIGLGVSVWFFAKGNLAGGFGMLAILVLINSHIGGAIGLALAVRRDRGKA